MDEARWPRWFNPKGREMNYIYENGYAIGYMQGDREILFAAPILASLLTD